MINKNVHYKKIEEQVILPQIQEKVKKLHTQKKHFLMNYALKI